MIVTCSKNDLIEGINISSKAISNRTSMPILECLFLECNNNEFVLMGNDLEIGIISKVKATIKENGKIAVSYKIFSEIIKKLPDKEIYIEADDKNIVIIKCDMSEYKIMGQKGDEYPKPSIIEKNNGFTIFQSELKNMIRQTLFSVAIEESKPVLTGELIEITDGFINIVAIDGYRISYRKSIVESKDNIKIVVPGKTMTEIIKILSSDLEKKVTLYFDKNHILFDLDDSIVVSRLLEGEFLSYKQILSDNYNTKIKINRIELLSGLERASLISSVTKKDPVKLEIEENKIIIKSNTTLGSAYEEVDIKKEGESLKISFNPKYLIDALKAIDDEYINIKLTSSLTPCIIVPLDSDDYKYLVLPVRSND
ncbi:MAG: DNA polymerase III subunit beta [Clostridiales bacterium GWD2_32_59]|nr:MAG: DNA polymerase III subunit beta [Clostridiales bacterium GWD2_32_59]